MSAPANAASTSKGRLYTHPGTGEKWPSVTTIISGGVPKPALPRWSAKAAAEYAVKTWDTLSTLDADERVALIKGAPWRESESAADLGSAVHEAIDFWCRNEPKPEWLPGVEPFMESFVDFLEKRDPTFTHNEVTVVNRTHGYAGTLDFIATISGLVTLGDVKTGKAVYPEVALQLVALAKAEFILTYDGEELPMPTVDILAALHVRPRSWTLMHVVPREASWRAFLAAREVWAWTHETAPNVFGAKVR